MIYKLGSNSREFFDRSFCEWQARAPLARNSIGMKHYILMIKRRLLAIWIQALDWIGYRSLAFAKYRLDARRPPRRIERMLRRKVRRTFRVALN